MMRLISLIIVGACLSFSCEKEEQAADPTILDKISGSWKLELLGSKSQGVPDQLFRWVFSKKNDHSGMYERYWFYRDTTVEYICVGATKGQFTLDGITVTATPNVHGSQLDTAGVYISDTIIWYYPGSPIFDLFGWESGFTVDVVGDILYYSYDENNNGMIDPDEIVEYIRE